MCKHGKELDTSIFPLLFSTGLCEQQNCRKLTLYSIDTHFNASATDSFRKKIVGKGEIAHCEQILLFPQCFQLNQITVPICS